MFPKIGMTEDQIDRRERLLAEKKARELKALHNEQLRAMEQLKKELEKI